MSDDGPAEVVLTEAPDGTGHCTWLESLEREEDRCLTPAEWHVFTLAPGVSLAQVLLETTTHREAVLFQACHAHLGAMLDGVRASGRTLVDMHPFAGVCSMPGTRWVACPSSSPLAGQCVWLLEDGSIGSPVYSSTRGGVVV